MRDDERPKKRYRKIETSMWVDRKFRELSPAPPNAQTLWINLLCGKRTTQIPGLVIATAGVLADDLGWPVEGFLKAFQEVSDKGMAKADWKAGLVVLPRALLDSHGMPRETSRPQSPNVIINWASMWDQVPECDLKDEYLKQVEAFAYTLGQAFGEAFRKGFLKAVADPSRIQDQDSGEVIQDQEQEQEIGSGERKRSTKAKRAPNRSRITADWMPSDPDVSVLNAAGIDAAAELRKFRDHHTAKGSLMADWDAAWRTWQRNAVEYAARAPRGGTRLPPAISAAAQVAARAQRLRGEGGGTP